MWDCKVGYLLSFFALGHQLWFDNHFIGKCKYKNKFNKMVWSSKIDIRLLSC